MLCLYFINRSGVLAHAGWHVGWLADLVTGWQASGYLPANCPPNHVCLLVIGPQEGEIPLLFTTKCVHSPDHPANKKISKPEMASQPTNNQDAPNVRIRGMTNDMIC